MRCLEPERLPAAALAAESPGDTSPRLSNFRTLDIDLCHQPHPIIIARESC